MSQARSALSIGAWLLTLAMALAVSASPAAALGTSEVILYDNADGGCNEGGRGLYLINSTDSLGSWGFNDRASGYKQAGTWYLYSEASYGYPYLTLSSSYDCDLSNNNYPEGGSWNDKGSSIGEY